MFPNDIDFIILKTNNRVISSTTFLFGNLNSKLCISFGYGGVNVIDVVSGVSTIDRKLVRLTGSDDTPKLMALKT